MSKDTLFLCILKTIIKNKSFESVQQIFFIKPKTSPYCLNQATTLNRLRIFLFIILPEALSI